MSTENSGNTNDGNEEKTLIRATSASAKSTFPIMMKMKRKLLDGGEGKQKKQKSKEVDAGDKKEVHEEEEIVEEKKEEEKEVEQEQQKEKHVRGKKTRQSPGDVVYACYEQIIWINARLARAKKRVDVLEAQRGDLLLKLGNAAYELALIEEAQK